SRHFRASIKQEHHGRKSERQESSHRLTGNFEGSQVAESLDHQDEKHNQQRSGVVFVILDLDQYGNGRDKERPKKYPKSGCSDKPAREEYYRGKKNGATQESVEHLKEI